MAALVAEPRVMSGICLASAAVTAAWAWASVGAVVGEGTAGAGSATVPPMVSKSTRRSFQRKPLGVLPMLLFSQSGVTRVAQPPPAAGTQRAARAAQVMVPMRPQVMIWTPWEFAPTTVTFGEL